MKPPVRFLNLSYYPLGDVTQYFGENPQLYAQFGLDGHNGIDIVRPWGEPIYSIEAGEVVDVKNDPHGFGKNVRIISFMENENGYYNQWVYGHNSINLVKVGDKVFAGQHIANMGNTGFTVSGDTPYWKNNPFAGTHVHIGLRQARKPKTGGWTYPESKLRISIVDTKNGYKGAINPLPFLNQTEATSTKENRGIFNKILSIQSLINKLKYNIGLTKVQ